MPTYEYACRGCGEHVEVVQSFRDDPLTTCGLCGGLLRKVFSAAGIIFKGSGYYVNDSRKAPPSEGGKSGDDAKTEGAKPDSGVETDSGGKTDRGDKTDGASDKAAQSAGSKSTRRTPSAAAAESA